MPSVTPLPGLAYEVVTGGQAVIVAPGGINGGFIMNPLSPSDSGVAAEPIYVDPTGADATLESNNTTTAIQPGQTWNMIPGQSTPTSVNAATGGHKFSVVYY